MVVTATIDTAMALIVFKVIADFSLPKLPLLLVSFSKGNLAQPLILCAFVTL